MNGPCTHLHAASTPGHSNQPGSSAVLRALPKTYTADTQATKTWEPLGLHRSSVVRTSTGPFCKPCEKDLCPSACPVIQKSSASCGK